MREKSRAEVSSFKYPGWRWAEGRGWYKPWRVEDNQVLYECLHCEDTGRITVKPYGAILSKAKSVYGEKTESVRCAVACSFCENPFIESMDRFDPLKMVKA